MMSGSWCGQVRSLQISSGWKIEFLIGLAVVRRPCSMWQHNLLSTRSCYFVDRDLHDRVNLSIAIYAIVLFHRSRITRSWYFIDRDLRDRFNLIGPGFEPRTKQYNIFIGPGFDSQARLPVSGQCDSWPMSLAPTNGELGWCGKTPHGKITARGKWSDYCKRKT